VNPRNVFRAFAVAEAITWVALLTGMFVKYAVGTTEVGVQIAGPIHGVAFIGYCLVTVVVAVDQGWSGRRTLLGLVSAAPPLMTIWFDRHVEKRDGLDDRWHSTHHSETAAQRAVSLLLRHRRRALAGFVVAVAVLTGIALLAGPPVGG